MAYNELWKPRESDVSEGRRRRNEKARVKELRKVKARDKRNKLKTDKDQSRYFCRKYLRLHETVSDVAIAYAISSRYETKMPLTDKSVYKLLIKFWESKSGQFPHRINKYQTASEFYKSEKWREVRYIALSNSNGCCDLCGRSKKDDVVLHVDHIEPRSLNPKLEYEIRNLQVLCGDCNLGKSNFDSKDWR